MSTPSAPPSAMPTDTPVDEFSHCHDGILAHMQAFGSLPALLDPAARARQIAVDMVAFFHDVVIEHHQQEEKELFPAVLASAAKGAERDEMPAMVERLTREHRQVETRWSKLEPALKQVAKGHDAALDPAAVASLVDAYTAHARYEEAAFLPRSKAILGRNSNHMAALGLSLHLRHSVPEVLAKMGHRI